MSPRNSPESTLLVTDDPAQYSETDQRLFAVSEELTEISVDEHDRVYDTISNVSIDLDMSLPVYEVAWKHILSSRRGRLLELVLVFLRLQTVVETEQPAEIHCDSTVDDGVRTVVEDVCDAYDITSRSDTQRQWLSVVRRVLTNSVFLLPFMIDQFAGLVWKRITRTPSPTEVTFVPALSRLDSVTPVLEKAPFDFELVITSMASSIGWKLFDSELEPFDPLPVSQFTSLQLIYTQIACYITLTRKVLVDDDLKTELAAVLHIQLGVDLDRTLTYVLQNAFRTRMFGSLFLYYLFDSAIDTLHCNKLVIGSLSPAGKAIIAKGIERGVEVYHIPHSIATSESPNPPSALTQFVAGKRDRQYYEQSPQVEQMWDTVVSGRPYLANLHDKATQYTDADADDSGTLQILIATQPLTQRKEFVKKTLDAIRRAEMDANIVIKTHPSEAGQTYDEFRTDSVTVREDGLHDLLASSDLTVTMNSNVGIESPILGTPTVCVNLWEPIVHTPTYAKTDDIPTVRTQAEIDDFMTNITHDKLASLLRDQTQFVEKNYHLSSNSVERIVETLDSTS